MGLTQITTGGVDDNINIDSNTLKVDGTNNRVGIGTAAPEVDLHVKDGNNGEVKIGGSSSVTGLKISYSNSGNTTTDIHQIYRSTSGNALLNIDTGTFTVATGTSGTERLRIDSSGRLLINTTTSASELIIGVGGGLKLSRNNSGSPSSGQSLMSIGFHGVNDTNSNAAAEAKIESFATAHHSGTTAPADLRFYTKPPGTGPGSAPSERLRIGSDGRVMIGTDTAAPNSLITVRATGPQLALYATPGNDSRLNMGDTDDHDIGMIAYANFDNSMRFTTNASERLRIDSSGRLLIGTTSSEAFNGTPSALQIEGTSDATTRISLFRTANDNGASVLVFAKARNTSHALLNNNDTIGKIEWYGADGNDTNQRAAIIAAEVDGTVTGNDMPGRLVFSTTPDNTTTPVERMRIDNSGNVGIGTASVNNSYGTNVNIHSSATDGARLKVSDGTSGNGNVDGLDIIHQSGVAYIIQRENNDIRFSTNNAERMRIDSSGKVGIGVSSPAAALHLSDANHGIAAGYVGGTLPNSAGIYTSSNSAYGQTYGSLIVQSRAEYSGYGISFRSSNTERARFTSGGYFKVSNNGGYYSSSNAVHEFNQSGTNVNMLFRTTHANTAATQVQFGVNRAATSNYWFLQGISGLGSGNDTEFYIRGDGNAYIDGSWNGGGADYAEYFEWSDGNTEAEDRRGISVVLDGDKIREAVDGEEPIGVISGNPSVVGDNDVDRWKNKYLRDDYGSYVLDEDGYRQLNPDYDSSVEYVQREDRPEWDTVGLMGKLRIRKGQITGSRWIKMRDVSSSVEEWLVR